ncbi:hypothetical protein E4O04_06340 [Treponema sp. OMZ 799]|uniref:hypothetical protein n=1 Tax=Treponema sp. OMZ 799 TaxID=2563668 RepID=UPI0020A3DEEF|nr:hypothetical protein [Treponema sp. OMZ 799]UTC77635.1 hypothetical protein E4O04_06340 [Treponema sp. OMZ 799]
MKETCLFLPDNLMTVLYEEQKLIQSLLDFPFRKTIPFFKTKEKFDSLTIYPPILHNSLIVRPCNSIDSFELNGGFVLGNARDKAESIILKLESLKPKTKLSVFSEISCRSWYYADVEFHEEKSGLCTWSIKNKLWQKAAK